MSLEGDSIPEDGAQLPPPAKQKSQPTSGTRSHPTTEEYLSVLNEEQRQAVVHQGKSLLILAGAGSGKTDNFSLLTRYGIIQERFSALLTDSIRGNLLEYCGYKTQLLEFIDFAHTPKNILIRAVLRSTTPKATKEKALNEVEAAIKEFNVQPTLYKLL